MAEIVFTEEDHRYHNTVTGKDHISVTTLLGQYEAEFDPDGKIAERCAKRDGITVAEIKAQWAKTAKAGTDKGSAIHNAVEEYLKEGDWDPRHTKILSHFSAQFDEYLRDTIHSELVLYNNEFELAGMADIIIEGKDWFKVWDIKTNKQIRFTNSFRTDRFLFDPVSHLINIVYSFQFMLSCTKLYLVSLVQN